MAPMRTNPLARAGWLAVLLPFALAACAGLDRSDRGTLQPQTVSGPCQVKKFFLVAYTAIPTDMTARGGQACSLTLINPDLQIINTAALITSSAAHGQAAAGLLSGTTQAGVSYTPQPGYAGPDSFTLTIEPSDRAVRFNVMVQPAG